MSQLEDLSGMVFGRLTAISPEKRGRRTYWVCKCECGNTTTTRKEKLKNGTTISCGCARKERNHNYTKTHNTLYVRWQGMIQRCHSPNHKKYSSYGGKGISVCDRWRFSFDHFLTDMGEPPFPNASLDRINPQKGYSPENVQWLTISENSTKRFTDYNEV